MVQCVVKKVPWRRILRFLKNEWKQYVQISNIGQIYASCAFTLHNGNTSCPIYFNPSLLQVTLFYHVKCLTWIAHNFNTCNCLEILLHLPFPYFIIGNLIIKVDKIKKLFAKIIRIIWIFISILFDMKFYQNCNADCFIL